ncbi:MAG: DUF3800 domain-containing protein [Verrucomicrobia bacterium]|nr:DUF3800 domain-containing protein [Verrucomicrobiota bacterium]
MNAPQAPLGSYGPFRNAEVSIYCDESRHEGQSDQKYMVIGGLWLPRGKRQDFLTGLREIQERHKITGELKWGKLSRRCLPAYSEIVSFVAAQSDIHFRCIVVDKSRVNTDKYFQSDRQLGFWVFYWHCLKQWMGNGNTYFISLDFKPESLLSGPRRLRDVLEKECLGRAWVNSLDCVDSKENLFCQIADLLIGAVGYEQNGLSGSESKVAFCKSVASAFGRQNLSGGDQPSRGRFNIFKIWS